MDHAKIADLLRHLPAGAGTRRGYVTHYVYGPDARLRRMRTKIKRRHPVAMFAFANKGATITLPIRLEPDNLMQCAAFIDNSAVEAGLDYDGFTISLGEAPDQTAQEPLENHAPPGTYLRFALGAGRFGYVLFLAGNQKDGYIFDCLAQMDDGTSFPERLAEAPRLYRQPVQGMMDPAEVQVVGPAPGLRYPITVHFRMATDHPAPDELAALAAQYGVAPDRIEEDWLTLLERLAAAGRRISRSDPVASTPQLKRSGRIAWADGHALPRKNAAEWPMPFGNLITLDRLRAALTGGADIIALTDATH
ncbi:hypothetical protein [Paracoccus sp. (in: a-proteobacteria)]|uniref:hypothetical protein n=1 Tax=Paracoccus sp. TaxID=267 RepID=UPI0026DF739B|nr:hypothetical protein [Paracoccus sp. (in: a-proteobacteria)]MDO5647635.1 hypothetical protein [Paracoccus sp. (in: a-proteobacteria)]